MKLRFVLVLAVLNLLCISAISQTSENPFGSATSDSSSLKGDIYYLPEGASSLPDFSSLTPVGSIYTKVLDVPARAFNSGFPGVTDRFEWFAIRYTGTFNVDSEGDYTFRLVSDDGSRLFIDGKKIIDNDGQHAPQSVSGNAYLARGRHSIEVDYFQGPRDYIALQLFWTPPGGSEGVANPQYTPSSSGTSSNFDLTGVWSCDDGGTYYIRQLGNTIWWYGEPSDSPGQWSNVAKGTISGNTINLDWSDVPKGNNLNSSILVLNIVSNDKLTATQKTGGFEGSIWTRKTKSPGSTPTQPGASILDHTMSTDIDESTSDVITRTNIFSSKDSKAYSWLNLGGVGAGTVEWKWYSPDGNLYHTGSIDIPQPSGTYWDSYYVWYYINIAGDNAANLPGSWHVDVYLNGQKLLTEQFAIGSISTGPSIPGSGSGYTNPWEDPVVRQLIDEWLLQQDRCVKKVYPGAYMDKWGRICGDTGTTTLSCVLTPDHPLDWDNYRYLWYNNWCPDYYSYRVQDYVELRQSGESFDDLAECKGKNEYCY